jgi:16S rRNA processing protein RimM
MTPSTRICIGVVTGAHGVRGAVRVRTYTERPEDVAAYGPLADETGERTFRVEFVRATKGGAVIRIGEVADRDSAEALRGTQLFIARDALPPPEPGEYYHADLIGLAVLEENGTPAGTVSGVFSFGAGDLLEIDRDGSRLLVPFTRAAVPVVDLETGRIVLGPRETWDAGTPEDSGDPETSAPAEAG